MNIYKTFNLESLPKKSPGTVKLDTLTKKLMELNNANSMNFESVNRKQTIIALILYYAKEHLGYEGRNDEPLPYNIIREDSQHVQIDVNKLPIPLQWMLCRFMDMA